MRFVDKNNDCDDDDDDIRYETDELYDTSICALTCTS